MKTEQEIKERIKMLTEKGDLPAFIGALMLLWVLDTDLLKLESYTAHIESGLAEISNYVTSME